MVVRLLFLACFIVPFSVAGQSKNADLPPTNYPVDYFRNPLDTPIYLAGNFGECRPGHFHSGIDIKTLGKENQPVHAAADGYISRIKMEKGGFGHGLYITHPNGYTTLYAHLNDFAPAIQKYVKAQQYEKQRWDVDLQFSPHQFPVKKGQQIAWSGNTGASTAPHLHFEIRNTRTEHPLNPELFGMPIVDHTPPVPAQIAIYKGNIYDDKPSLLNLRKGRTGYTPVATTDDNFTMVKDTISLVASNAVGIGLNVDDYMEGSDNTLAVYTVALFMDDQLQGQVRLDDIGYDVTRYINGYADYKTRKNNGTWVQCLFQLPGNRLSGIYSHLNANKGRLDLSDKKPHKISLVVIDDKENTSTVTFYLRGGNAYRKIPPVGSQRFYANSADTFSDEELKFTLNEKQLYDDFSFVFSKKQDASVYSEQFQLHYPYVPVHEYFELYIKPNKPIPPALKNKIALIYSDGKDEEGSNAAATADGWYKTRVRDFGTYWLDVDTTAPTIKSLQKNGANLSKAKQITFEVKDDVTSVRAFSGYLDGKWICFEQHGSSFFYKFDEHCTKGKHELRFTARDENDNERTVKLSFVR